MTDQLPASAGPVGDLPDAWVEAASKAAYISMTNDPQPWSDDSLERAIPKALAAALPLIRAHLADQIDAVAEEHPGAAELAGEFTYNRGIYNGFKRAARLARTGDWRKNDGTDTEARGGSDA